MSEERIQTPCPSCGSRSLFIGEGGHLTCSVIGCKSPAVELTIDALRAEVEGKKRALEVWKRDWQKAHDRAEAAEAENAKLREALADLLRDAIILSDDYLAAMDGYPDDKTLQGFEAGRWRRLAVTAKNARAALKAGEKP